MSLFLCRVATTLAIGALAVPALAQNCTPMIPAADLVTPGKLHLAINPTLPPIQIVDSNGELQGLTVELGKEVAKRLCLPLEYVRIDFPAMIPGLGSGRFDGINTAMFWTEERSKIMFAVPYALSAIGVIVPIGSKYVPKEPSELQGHVIAVDADTYQERWLRNFDKESVAKGAKPMEIRAFITPTEVIAALRGGQAEAAALPTYTTSELVKRGTVGAAIDQMGATPTMMAFRKRSVAEAVVKALKEMKADGTYAKMLDSVGMPKLPEEFAIRGPGPSL
jgi:polar amino acid transport system substrate-binding protein